MKWLRKLFGIRTPQEDRQAGMDFVDAEVSKCNADKVRLTELWYYCDPVLDRTEFDYGVRDRLLELNIPHPLHAPDIQDDLFNSYASTPE